jgi:flagellar motor protein MotB
MAVTTQDDAEDWRPHRLAFLKSAYDRVQMDLARSATGGTAWREESDTILRAMAEIAKPMTADSVPSDIKALLLASAPPEQIAPAVPTEAVPTEKLVDTDAESAMVEPLPRPIAQRQLSESSAAAAAVLAPGEAAAFQLPLAVAKEPEPTATSAETSSRLVGLEATSVVEQPEPPLTVSGTPRPLSELEAALRAEKTDRGLRVMLPSDTLFDSTSNALDPAANSSLSSLAELIAAMAPREIVVIGHTDLSGENAVRLSKREAHAIVTWLEAHVEYQPRFVEPGHGRTRPVAPNKNADGSDSAEWRKKNRIEILLRRN